MSFRTPRKISTHLAQTKLYPLKRDEGSRKCDKKDVKFEKTLIIL